ncbi:GntR family transcriptional regulator [Streptomyces sp. NPDC093544]|jgi:GntR family transcriptional repressor for pyruvate dehydrogenase complex|uniref:FadR/GntR family transcriptional regulator n=1 Tax=Streptomyces sp. NPDC093544 TaxID=3155200 RepID=UPI00342FD0E5
METFSHLMSSRLAGSPSDVSNNDEEGQTVTAFVADGGFDRNRASVADRVLRDLESSILSGRLKRGSKLPSEKELASYYGVSSPTIREAIRALSAMRLVEVRHGSGMTVVADSSTLMASAMRSVVELENIDLPSILKLAETLNLQAVDLAIATASPEEIDAVLEIAKSFNDSMSSEEFIQTLEGFLRGLIALSHNKLLEVVASFVITSHLSMARRVRQGPESEWASDVARLRGVRIAIVEAVAAHDRLAAFKAVREYTTQTLAISGETGGDQRVGIEDRG